MKDLCSGLNGERVLQPRYAPQAKMVVTFLNGYKNKEECVTEAYTWPAKFKIVAIWAEKVKGIKRYRLQLYSTHL